MIISNRGIVTGTFSLKLCKILKKFRVNSFFRDFKFNKILKKRKEPIRSWTVDLNGKKALMNGLMIIQNQSFDYQSQMKLDILLI